MTCPTCHTLMTGVQYILSPCDYDGVSEYACDQCALRVGRWSGLTLGEGELEARYGVDSPYRMVSQSETVEQAEKDNSAETETQTPAGLFGEMLDD